MPSNSIITSYYKNNQVKLVFNETFTLLERDTFFEIFLDGELNNWVLKIIFQNNLDEYAYNADTNIFEIENKSIIEVKFNQWYSDNWVELYEPKYVESKDKKVKAYIKIRASGNQSTNFRTVDVSIWKIQTV